MRPAICSLQPSGKGGPRKIRRRFGSPGTRGYRFVAITRAITGLVIAASLLPQPASPPRLFQPCSAPSSTSSSPSLRAPASKSFAPPTPLLSATPPSATLPASRGGTRFPPGNLHLSSFPETGSAEIWAASCAPGHREWCASSGCCIVQSSLSRRSCLQQVPPPTLQLTIPVRRDHLLQATSRHRRRRVAVVVEVVGSRAPVFSDLSNPSFPAIRGRRVRGCHSPDVRPLPAIGELPGFSALSPAVFRFQD